MSANYQIIVGCLLVAICSIGVYFGGLMIKNGIEKRSNRYLEPQIRQPVEKKTAGNNSQNINAPNAKTVQVNYGIPEKVFKEWVKELKGEIGIDKIIEHLLEDLKHKNVTIEAMQIQIQDGIAMRKELERRLTERPSDKSVLAQASNKMQPLIKFNHQDFIDNFITFRAYYQYRKTLQLLNPEMLIELLNIYFRSVLLYPSNDMKKYYITASDGRLLLLQIEGHNEKGDKTLISLPELSNSLLKDVCTDFIKTANAAQYEMLIDLFNRALATPDLDKIHKTNILDAQNIILKNKLFRN